MLASEQEQVINKSIVVCVCLQIISSRVPSNLCRFYKNINTVDLSLKPFGQNLGAWIRDPSVRQLDMSLKGMDFGYGKVQFPALTLLVL